MISRLFLAFLSIISFTAVAQVNPNGDRQIVLLKSQVGKTYIFDKSKGDEYNRTELTYLGKFKTRDGRVFKVLISRWYWGTSPRATSRIVFFNSKNQSLGNYYVDMTYDLPARILRNALVFQNKDKEGCDQSLVTRVSFNNSPPRRFFVACNNEFGDFYYFGEE